MFGSIDVRGKGDAVLGELAQSGQAEDLKPSGVGRDRMIPAHEGMQAPTAGDHVIAGAQIQMIGIAQDDFCSKVFEILGAERFDGALGANRHENGSGHDPMGGADFTSAGLAVPWRGE